MSLEIVKPMDEPARIAALESVARFLIAILDDGITQPGCVGFGRPPARGSLLSVILDSGETEAVLRQAREALEPVKPASTREASERWVSAALDGALTRKLIDIAERHECPIELLVDWIHTYGFIFEDPFRWRCENLGFDLKPKPPARRVGGAL